jgi:AraC-like DNA-binding protein
MNDTSKWLETSLLAISSFNIFLLTIRVLFSFRRFQPANLMLLGWLFVTGTALVNMYLIDTGLIFNFPWLYRLPSPLYYLLFPFAFFYLRMIVTDKTSLNKWDFIHLLPAAIHLVEMSPFYLSSNDFKLDVMLEAFNNPLSAFTHSEGWLTNYQHNIIRGLLGIGYSIAMFRILSNHKYKKIEHKNIFPIISNWLTAFSVIQFLIGFTLFLFLGFPQVAPASERASLIFISLAIIQISAAIILLFNPIILYGIPKLKASTTIPEIKEEPRETEPFENETATELVTKPRIEKEVEFTAYNPKSEKEQALINRLEQLMQTEKPFLQPQLSSQDTAAALGVPLHHLSYLLNHVMFLRFTDYINEKRIKYMEEKIMEGELKQYTLEALALSAGFNSRITFIRAVKKIRGVTPSEYFGKR